MEAPTIDQQVIKSEKLPFTPPLNEAKSRFINSFYFSQGNAKVQQAIFAYLATTQETPWTINDEYLYELRSSCHEAIDRYLNLNPKGGFIHSGKVSIPGTDDVGSLRGVEGENSRRSETNSQFNNFIDYMTGKMNPLRDKDQLIEIIAEGILVKDNQYLNGSLINNGRPRRSEGYMYKIRNLGKSKRSEQYNPRKDKFLSQICYYGLAGNSTNDPAYDMLFADIARFVRVEGQIKLDREIDTGLGLNKNDTWKTENGLRLLNKVINSYNKRHLEAQVAL